MACRGRGSEWERARVGLPHPRGQRRRQQEQPGSARPGIATFRGQSREVPVGSVCWSREGKTHSSRPADPAQTRASNIGKPGEGVQGMVGIRHGFCGRGWIWLRSNRPSVDCCEGILRTHPSIKCDRPAVADFLRALSAAIG